MKTYRTLLELNVAYRKNGRYENCLDAVAEEVPVALVYNGISHAVMLATPADLDDFAVGFSLTEGIVERPEEIYALETVEAENGIRIELDIASERFHYLKERRRNLTGRTGCGLCGTDSLAQAVKVPVPVESTVSLTPEVLFQGFEQLENRQTLRRDTGATHAAAWLGDDGVVSLIREDIGRHNALDKLIGALFNARTDQSQGAVLVTSRASYEMVQKCAAAKIGFLAAVSAPTALAVRMADKADLTLIGFVRKNSLAVYTHSRRLICTEC